MTYTLQKTIEIIRQKIGYNISDTAIYGYKKKGLLIPSGEKYHENINRRMPVYDDATINKFVEGYIKLVADKKTLQWRSKKLPIDNPQDIL